jgi:hypothetical protein
VISEGRLSSRRPKEGQIPNRLAQDRPGRRGSLSRLRLLRDDRNSSVSWRQERDVSWRLSSRRPTGGEIPFRLARHRPGRRGSLSRLRLLRDDRNSSVSWRQDSTYRGDCHLDDQREERSPSDLHDTGMDEGDLSVGFASFEMTGTRRIVAAGTRASRCDCHLDDRREERSPADLRESSLDEGDLSVGFASFEMTGRPTCSGFLISDF